jgi:hypothetical protein
MIHPISKIKILILILILALGSSCNNKTSRNKNYNKVSFNEFDTTNIGCIKRKVENITDNFLKQNFFCSCEYFNNNDTLNIKLSSEGTFAKYYLKTKIINYNIIYMEENNHLDIKTPFPKISFTSDTLNIWRSDRGFFLEIYSHSNLKLKENPITVTYSGVIKCQKKANPR